MDALENINVLEQIDVFCAEIENEILIYGDYVSNNLIKATHQLLSYIRTAPNEIKKMVEEKICTIVLKSKSYAKVWLYSSTLTINYNSEVLKEFLEFLIQEKNFSPNVRHFLFYQIKNTIFNHICLDDEKSKYLVWKLFEKTVESFKNNFMDIMQFIPYEQRDPNTVLVITEQILEEEHGPTKTALDRCKVLIKNMGKKVLLLNTAEIASIVGMIPYYGAIGGQQNDDLIDREYLEWKGTKIPYVQCENNMPNIASLRMLLQMVKNLKPRFCVSIGGNSILGNLVDTIIPVLTVGLVPSDFESTMTSCQTLSRELREKDLKLLELMGKDEKSIILSTFTSDLQPQRTKVTREEIGLQEDKFIVVIVGNRLDSDIDEHFMNMLACALDDDMEAAFIGNTFISFDGFLERVPSLKGKVHYLGATHDILSWLEVCDLYINPKRKGGGTSAVEALFKGLPVITTAYGDVAANAGKEFYTESYDTMSELIQKYKKDQEFYNKMSALARERSEILLDTESEFQRIIEEFEKRTRGK